MHHSSSLCSVPQPGICKVSSLFWKQGFCICLFVFFRKWAANVELACFLLCQDVITPMGGGYSRMEAYPSTLVPLVRDGCPKCGHVEICQAERISTMKSFDGNHTDAIYRSSTAPIFCSGSSHLHHIDDDIISTSTSLCPNYIVQKGYFRSIRPAFFYISMQ